MANLEVPSTTGTPMSGENWTQPSGDPLDEGRGCSVPTVTVTEDQQRNKNSREVPLHPSSADGSSTGRVPSGLSTPRSEVQLKPCRLEKKYDSQLLSPPASRKRKSKVGHQLKHLLAPTYKTRCCEFKRIFKLPEREKLVIDYSCAYQKEILLHGRLYLSQNWLCFYSNIFRWETMVTLRYKDIVNITKERTAKIIPNAIYVVTSNNDKLFFTSLSTRDKTYMMLFRLWQYALLDQTVNPVEMWSWAQHGYEEADMSDSADETGEDDEAVPNGEMVGFASGPKLAKDGVRKRSSCRKSLGQKRGSDPAAVCNDGPVFVLGEQRDVIANENSNNDVASSNSEVPEVVPQLRRSAIGPVGSEPSTSRQLRLSSDSSENDEEEVSCPCVTHEGRELMNSVYPLSVDQLFLWLFTDSEFFQQFQELRKTKNLILSDWKIDRTTGAKLRQISYSVAVNHALAPKTCEVVEKQECADVSKAGRIYVIKVEVQNYGIPYSDAFQVLLTYCLTRMSSSHCRLRINSKLVYRKSCWGIVKSFIEKNALFNMLNHFADLGKLLQFECRRLGLAASFPADASVASTVEDKIDGISVGNVATVVARQGGDATSDSSRLDFYAHAIIVILLVLVSICLLILYNQCKEARERRSDSVPQRVGLLSRQLYRILIEEPSILRTLLNQTKDHSHILSNVQELGLLFESALRTIRAVESSIQATMDSMLNSANDTQEF
uniref:VASt domain-containing protein n=1 Tax=Trichuris muris TaxID=70415 RepID=A0A5S6QVC0_TRIMR